MKKIDKWVTQIKLVFLVFGDAFNPEDFTKLVNIPPSEIWIKGDEIKTNIHLRKSKTLPKRKESAWEYTEGYMQTLDFGILSRHFEHVFSNKKHEIRKFIEANDLDATVNIIVEVVDGQTPSLTLSKDFISLLNDMDLELDFEVYILCNE